jgi:hypothetical protein
MEIFDLEVQLEDLMIYHDDTSDKSADTWKIGLELHEDDSSIFSSINSKFDNQYQAKERIEIQKRRDLAIAASDAVRKARSDVSYTNSKRHHRHGSRFKNLEYSERQSLSKNLDSSFLSIDEQGNIIPKTPEAALVVAQAYLHTT